MIPLRLDTFLAYSGEPASLAGAPGNPEIRSIVSDSRKVVPGCLFAALSGARVDGHDFVADAAAAGAVAVLVERTVDVDVPQLVVKDSLLALGRIAAGIRQQVDPMVVAITGSNGKTTVKEMVRSILRRRGRVLATVGNYNNELGLPLTLFGLDAEHEYAVLELGATRKGDIEYLANIARPDVALVNNVGPAHLEGFGDEEGVARAKGEIYQGLAESGWAVFNADEPWYPLWQSLSTAGQELTFGTSENCDVRLAGDEGSPRIEMPTGAFDLRLPLPGRHNQLNAAAAAAIACAAGVPLEDVRLGLETVAPVPGRLAIRPVKAGWTIIDDSYNANPASLYAALQVLSGMPGEAWLVLGDMAELGVKSQKLHVEMGDAARALGVQRLFTVGEQARHAAEEYGEGAVSFSDIPALVKRLTAELHPGVNCLIKGSRSMGMERLVAAVCEFGEDLREAS